MYVPGKYLLWTQSAFLEVVEALFRSILGRLRKATISDRTCSLPRTFLSISPETLPIQVDSQPFLTFKPVTGEVGKEMYTIFTQTRFRSTDTNLR